MSKHLYQLRITDGFYDIKIPNFPDLEIKHIRSENRLCPSNYTDAMCFWEGDIVVELEINGLVITLNDHDSRKGIYSKIISPNGSVYLFQGEKPKVIDRSKEKTYLIFSISIESQPSEPLNNPKIKQYDLGQPFTIELSENATTGYKWVFETTPGLKIIESTYTHHCGNKVGCGGVRTLILKGTKRGLQSVNGKHLREWEKKDVKPKRLQFEIL